MKAVEPYYVRFHWTDGFAPFLVTHEGEEGDVGPEGDALSDEEAIALRTGWVLVRDLTNDAGLQRWLEPARQNRPRRTGTPRLVVGIQELKGAP